MVIEDQDKLLFEFRAGRIDAFYRTLYRGMVLYAVKLLGDEKDLLAEDCVQEAIYDAWKIRETFSSFNALKGYLYTAIKNDIISIHRKAGSRERYLRQLEDPVFSRNAVIDQEAQRLLYEAVNRLPEKMKLVFEMSFIEGLKTTEIAERLRLTDSSVRKYKAGALELLRTQLKSSLFSFLFLV